MNENTVDLTLTYNQLKRLHMWAMAYEAGARLTNEAKEAQAELLGPFTRVWRS